MGFMPQILSVYASTAQGGCWLGQVAMFVGVSGALYVEHPGGFVSGAFYCTANSAQGGTLVLGHGRGSQQVFCRGLTLEIFVLPAQMVLI